MVAKVLISIAFFAFCIQNAKTQIGMGPMNMKIIRLDKCPAEQDILQLSLVDRDDGFQGLKGALDLPFPLDETVSHKLTVDKVSNGQIQKGVFKHSSSYTCQDMIKFMGIFYKKLADEMKIPHGCPIAEGKYEVENFKFDQNDIAIKTFLYGRFILTIEYYKDDKKVTCVEMEFTNNRPGESV